MRHAEAFLAARCCDLPTATGDDLEEFMAHLLTRRSAHTAATRYKVLRILYKCGALRAIDYRRGRLLGWTFGLRRLPRRSHACPGRYSGWCRIACRCCATPEPMGREMDMGGRSEDAAGVPTEGARRCATR